MNYFLNVNKNIIIFSLIILIAIPTFGFNLFLHFLGNIIILLLLIPILLILLVFIVFKSYQSKLNICEKCGSISFNSSESCINCGSSLGNINVRNESDKKPSESTIEVKAEEIK